MSGKEIFGRQMYAIRESYRSRHSQFRIEELCRRLLWGACVCWGGEGRILPGQSSPDSLRFSFKTFWPLEAWGGVGVGVGGGEGLTIEQTYRTEKWPGSIYEILSNDLYDYLYVLQYSTVYCCCCYFLAARAGSFRRAYIVDWRACTATPLSGLSRL
jgi:hypothetical protein